nr:tetratricopeptide repeat protein [Pedobacter sp. ASV19]
MANVMMNKPKDVLQDELTSAQQVQIDEYAGMGNDEMDNENYVHAIGWFNKALDIIPVPQENWEATGWLSAAVGDAYFNLGNYEKAIRYFEKSKLIYGAEGSNPFVLLRLGQCYFHLSKEEQAKECLLGAYMLEGKELFDDEKVYFDFLSSRVLL